MSIYLENKKEEKKTRDEPRTKRNSYVGWENNFMGERI